jgi:antitoxin (DNA-binding transcriptional repressor) of toxin-antitoxin stability system
MASESVGIREFRSRLADYISQADTPVAITRHGETVGYFIPARADRSKSQHAALRAAAAKLDAMLAAAGFSEDDLESVLTEFRARRKARK